MSPRSFIPPPAVARAARKGLEMRRAAPPSRRCCTPVGIARARQLSNRQPVSLSTVKRMVSWFARHSKDKRAPGSKSLQAFYMWGGPPGEMWSRMILKVYK